MLNNLSLRRIVMKSYNNFATIGTIHHAYSISRTQSLFRCNTTASINSTPITIRNCHCYTCSNLYSSMRKNLQTITLFCATPRNKSIIGNVSIKVKSSVLCMSLCRNLCCLGQLLNLYINHCNHSSFFKLFCLSFACLIAFSC